MTASDGAPGEEGSPIAAVDLGSNSFHLIVAREEHGQLRVIDRDRSQVMLASGLEANGALNKTVEKRALRCLARFGERVREMQHSSVRVVGTNTLRAVNDDGAFVARAEQAIGHPIEVVSGIEEARLVYLGVAHHTPSSGGMRLVVDIGGGSTEVIVGDGFEPLESASLEMGCVRNSLEFFKGGKITEKRFERAVVAAQLELRVIKRRFRSHGWTSAIGASGTVRSVESILRQQHGDGVITLERLLGLRRLCVEATSTKRLSFPGMTEGRAMVFAGGLSILIGLFRSLRVDSMTATSGALREGVLYDMIGRIHKEDVRNRTIRMFCDRYHVDVSQAARVERLARRCFEQVKGGWGLEDGDVSPLVWAARLHEVGRSISYSGHHRHGAYMVENADMPGFSQEHQRLIAILIRGHRRKIASNLFDALPATRRPRAQRLLTLLRIATLLNRSRSENALADLGAEADGDTIRLWFPETWLTRHVMTHADLKAERTHLGSIGIHLVYR